MRTRVFLIAVAAALSLALRLTAANHDKWIEARSPNFIVVSNAGDFQARKVAKQFEQIRAAFRESLPYANAHSSPVITILAAKDEDSLGQLLPEFWATKGHAHPAGWFQNTFYQFQVAVNVGAQGPNPYETIYHEYYHSLTMPYFPKLPTWVAEGLAEFYGNSVISDREADIGVPNPGLVAMLRNTPLIPLDVLFNVNHTSPYYNEEKKTSIFYAESWALIHYLMLGDKSAHRPLFNAYLEALDRGASPVEAGKAFGDLGKLKTELERYVGSLAFYSVKAPPPAKLSDQDIVVRTLSDAEEDAYRGGFLAFRGQFKAAQPLLEESVRLDPQLALAHQNLALSYFLQKQRPDALKEASESVALDSRNGLTRYLRATLSLNAEPRNNQQIEDDLRQAIALSPEFTPAYSSLAGYLASADKNLPEALTFAQKAVSLEPGTIDLQFGVAQVLARMHRYDEAEVMARQVGDNTPNPPTRQQVDSFLQYLQKLRAYDAEVGQRRAANAGDVRDADQKETEPATSSAGTGVEEKVQLRYRTVAMEGTITQVTCRDSEMDLTLMSGQTPVIFHTDDRTKVSYTSDVPIQSRDLKPCTELKGHMANITYRPTQGEARTNEIMRIGIEK